MILCPDCLTVFIKEPQELTSRMMNPEVITSNAADVLRIAYFPRHVDFNSCFQRNQRHNCTRVAVTRLFNLTIWQPYTYPENAFCFTTRPGHSRRETFLYFVLESHLPPPSPIAIIPCSEWKTSRSVDAIIADVESKKHFKKLSV